MISKQSNSRIHIKQRAVNKHSKCYMYYQVCLDGKLYTGGFKTLASAETYAEELTRRLVADGIISVEEFEKQYGRKPNV